MNGDFNHQPNRKSIFDSNIMKIQTIFGRLLQTLTILRIWYFRHCLIFLSNSSEIFDKKSFSLWRKSEIHCKYCTCVSTSYLQKISWPSWHLSLILNFENDKILFSKRKRFDSKIREKTHVLEELNNFVRFNATSYNHGIICILTFLPF